MGESRTVFKLLILGFAAASISLSIVAPQFVFAVSENWSEMTRFSGTGALTTTGPFTCDHVEWRIRWELEPQSGFLSAYIYPHEPQSASFESIIKSPENNETNGTVYIPERSGTFHLVIMATGETSYTLIIEQNLVSIPEFPSWAPLLIMVIAVVAVAVIYRCSLSNNRRNQIPDRGGL